MIDLHTHTLLSDGELLLSELVRHAEVAGYSVVNVCDHADLSNLDFIVPRVAKAAAELRKLSKVRVIAGVEITHVPPAQFASLVKDARMLGAQLVTAHGETIVEPVASGTNEAAVEAVPDILAHPGLITEKVAALAAKKGVYLEITGRKGHSLTNGHVAQVARATGAKLVFGTDSHGPGDLVSKDQAERILRGAGLDAAEIAQVWKNAKELAARALAR